MALDFFADGWHLVIDAMVPTVYKNTMLQKITSIPWYAAKQTEDVKFQADRTSNQPNAAPHGGPHVLVPFAWKMEADLGPMPMPC